MKRELREETGLEIAVTGYFGAIPDRYQEGTHTLNLFYTAVVTGGHEQAGSDVSELIWMFPDALPDRSQMAFANGVKAIERVLGRALPSKV